MSAHVHRDGAHQITFATTPDCRPSSSAKATLCRSRRETKDRPHPPMAHDLADELHEWASLQQTLRSKETNGVR